MTASGSSRKIKVVDRRWFTEDGGVRKDRQAAPPAKKAAPKKAPETTKNAEQPVTSRAFLELLSTLAQQAELMMAGGPGYPPQPEQAQRLVDYLEALRNKTQGNLSAEESGILRKVLFDLRGLSVKSSP